MNSEKKESADFKISHLRLPNLRSRKEKKKKIKINEIKRPVGQHKAYQFLHNGCPRRRGEIGEEKYYLKKEWLKIHQI